MADGTVDPDIFWGEGATAVRLSRQGAIDRLRVIDDAVMPRALEAYLDPARPGPPIERVTITRASGILTMTLRFTDQDEPFVIQGDLRRA